MHTSNLSSVTLVPSARLLTAAMSGLLGLHAGACEGDTHGDALQESEPLEAEDVDALCKEQVEKALDDQDTDALCSDKVSDAEAACDDKVEAAKKDAASEVEPELSKLCTDMVDSARSELEKTTTDLKAEIKTLKDELAALKEKARPLLLTSDEKTISAEQKEYTFAELTKRCDERGGYTQVHAACGGHNSCAGFSYGDWGPGAAMLTEHSCTGVNGCLGLSCVVLPKDSGKSGKELYEETEFAEPLNNCGGCHGGYNDANGKFVHDTSYFAVYVLEGGGRTAENWLDRAAAEQERVTAFGARSVLPGGTAIQNMAEYHGVMSRAEIQRVVEHIRTLKPFMYTIKTTDKATEASGPQH